MLYFVQEILADHFRLATDAALLMAVGLFLSIPVNKYRIAPLTAPPIWVMSNVRRLMGDSGNMIRMAVVIWLFNSMVMFIYMASGIHQLLPMVFAIWTGMNIGIVLGSQSWKGEDAGESPLVPPSPSEDAWHPHPAIAMGCGLLVLALELPCFFYSIALGMRMGAEVAWQGTPYLEALQPRAAAFAIIIFPTLLISAISETIAIRAGTAEGDE